MTKVRITYSQVVELEIPDAIFDAEQIGRRVVAQAPVEMAYYRNRRDSNYHQKVVLTEMLTGKVGAGRRVMFSRTWPEQERYWDGKHRGSRSVKSADSNSSTST